MKNKKTWSKMTAVEKRKAIANDVIQNVNNTTLRISHTYCDVHFDPDDAEDSKEFQWLLSEKGCNVCAMGALMATDIINRNNYNREWDDFDIIKRFKGIFSRLQLRTIEAAYEKTVNDEVNNKLEDYDGNRTDLAEKAILFGKKIGSDKNRLIAIMQNIIDNPSGFFDPYTLKK